MTERLDELGKNLNAVRAQIAAACADAGRDPAEVTLVAVTKTFPVADIMLLSQLGITDIGENKDQEAAPKAAACAAAGLAVRWHFVGQLQANKAGSVVRYADTVHSVDRIKLADALGRRAAAAGRVISCLVQVSLDEPEDGTDRDDRPGQGDRAGPGDGAGHGDAAGQGDGARGGARPGQVLDVATAIAGQHSLRLAGVMGIAPLGEPARPAYARLRSIAETVRSEYPEARVISAGMSADMAEAIAGGATHVRIGTALLGGRPPFVR